MGVDSELAYKRQCIKNRHIMFHAHIGMSSWPATQQALAFLFEGMGQAGGIVDRAGLCLDRRMGARAHARRQIPAESGPTLDSPEMWQTVGQHIPIQPHMGDLMLYTLKQLGPAAFERAFGQGVTDERQPHGRRSVQPTDVFTLLTCCIEELRPGFEDPRLKAAVANRKIVIASTDVHNKLSRCSPGC